MRGSERLVGGLRRQSFQVSVSAIQTADWWSIVLIGRSGKNLIVNRLAIPEVIVTGANLSKLLGGAGGNGGEPGDLGGAPSAPEGGALRASR